MPVEVASVDSRPFDLDPAIASLHFEPPVPLPVTSSPQQSLHRPRALNSPRVEARNLQLLPEPILDGTDAVVLPPAPPPAREWATRVAPPLVTLPPGAPPPGAMVRGGIGAAQRFPGCQRQKLLPLGLAASSPSQPAQFGKRRFGGRDVAAFAQTDEAPAASLGIAAVGVATANGAKAELCWARLEDHLEVLHSDGPASLAALVQLRSALLQRLRALDAQLRIASGALRGEYASAQRIEESLRKAREEGERAKGRYRDEFSALNEQQCKLEAQWLGTMEASGEVELRAVEIRKGNKAMREELRKLCSDSAKQNEPDRGSALSDLRAAITQAEERGEDLKEELRRVQGLMHRDTDVCCDSDVSLHISFDGGA